MSDISQLRHGRKLFKKKLEKNFHKMKTRRDFIKISTIGAGATVLGMNALGSNKFKIF